jgi:energy-coupling factor transport system permease protein
MAARSPDSSGRALHPVACVAWTIAAVVALSSTRNPVYLLLILTCIGLVLAAARAQAYAPPLTISPWRFGAIVVAISAVFNGLTAHFGATVLFHLPAWMPLLGGPVTLEALVYGALNGLVLAGFFAAFAVFYLLLPTQALIRLIPRAFYPAAIVVSVAVAFVPTTLAQFQQIREAQLLRGHQVRGLRDWLPLLMPLLVGGLERALQLAEAMTARGFAVTSDPAPAASRISLLDSENQRRLLLAAGLLALLAGLLLRLFARSPSVGLVVLAAGALMVLLALWLQGRQVRRTIYRPQPWTRHDWLVAAASALVFTLYLLPIPYAGRASLAYSPYPQLSLPTVDPLLMLATLALAAPAAYLRH